MATLSNKQKRAMSDGLRRWQREQTRDAIARVLAFERWLKSGSPSGTCPEIPSDPDYAVARRAGKVRR